MSFCYAQRHERGYKGKTYMSIDMFSDTKVELTGAFKANWNDTAYAQIMKYGLAKTMVLAPNLCLSFAGNDIALVNSLLTWCQENSPFEVDALLSKAFEIHMNSGDLNNIEFLLAFKCDQGALVRIACIKEGKIQEDCEHAWIGSHKAFERLQELRLRDCPVREVSVDMFWKAMTTCHDESVGGLPMHVCYTDDRFEYACWLSTFLNGPKIVKTGEMLPLFDAAQNGGFTVSVYEQDNEPVYEFLQNGVSVAYSARYRYGALDSYSPMTKRFLLPIVFETESRRILPV